MKLVAKMLKAIWTHEKAETVIVELQGIKLKEAAKKVEDSIEETPTYYGFSLNTECVFAPSMWLSGSIRKFAAALEWYEPPQMAVLQEVHKYEVRRDDTGRCSYCCWPYSASNGSVFSDSERSLIKIS